MKDKVIFMVNEKITVATPPESLSQHSVADLVQLAMRYSSSIYLSTGDKKINAKSIMGMLSLDLIQGQEITVNAVGPDEKEALEEIRKFLAQDGLQ